MKKSLKTSDIQDSTIAAPETAPVLRPTAVVQSIDGPRRGETGVPVERIEAIIEKIHIGERIKQLRQRKGMGLVELGRHTGLSASFLSQLETGRVVPTLRNLSRIAMVFSRDISFFFTPKRDGLFRLQRANERQRLPQTGAAEPGYMFESLGIVPGERAVAPYIAEFLPGTGGSKRAHQHAGSEFLYVLSGTLEIVHGERTELLDAGDAAYFHSSTTHSYRRVGDSICTAMIMTLPENSAKSVQRPPVADAPARKRMAG